MDQPQNPTQPKVPEPVMHVFRSPDASLPPTMPNRSRRWVWILGILIVLGGLGFGGYYAYSKGYLRLPFLSKSGDELVSKMIAALADIKNAQYSLRIDLTAEPREAGATSILEQNANTDIEGLSPYPLFDYEELVNAIPIDMQFSGGVTTYVESDVPAEDANALLKFDGTYSGGDISVAFDVEIRKVQKNIYALVNKFPSLFFFDLSAIKEKWVAIDIEDDFGGNVKDMIENQDTRESLADAQQALIAAIDSKLVTIGTKLPDEVIAGVKSEHFRVDFTPANLPAFYTLLIERRKQAGKDVASLEDAQITTQEPEITQMLQRVAENSSLELWIDPVKSHLRKIQWKLRIVPPENVERLQGKQFSLQFGLTLENVNEKVRVDTPTQTIDYDEAVRLVTGVTKEEQDFEKQSSRVYSLRSSLTNYFRLTGSYPESIEDLQAQLEQEQKECQENEEKSSNTNQNVNGFQFEDPSECYVGLGYGDTSIIDVYTEKAFPYTKEGDGYSFTYEIRHYEDMSSYNKEDYADGTNTATHDFLSVEAENTSAKRDAKRISDVRQIQSALELYYNDQLTPGYPAGSSDPVSSSILSSSYIAKAPVAPEPNDGSCSEEQNTYSYQAYTTGGAECTTAPCPWYNLTFCLGSETGGLEAGAVTASPAGIVSGDKVDVPAGLISTTPSTNTNLSLNTSTSGADTDGDGLSDEEEESVYQTNPFKKDTDGDGLDDQYEILTYSTNPLNTDTDGDGFDDGTEMKSGYDPRGEGKLPYKGAWTECVSLDQTLSCASYCQSVGKTCVNYGVTSRGYPNWGAEAWTSATSCQDDSQTGQGQKSCSENIGSGGARWKCFCKE